VILDCAVYRDGKRLHYDAEPADLCAALATVTKPDDFVWIGMHEPSYEEMSEVANDFSLHRLAVEDAVQDHQRAKLERFGDDSLFMVLKTLRFVEERGDVETGQISVFVGQKYVITVRHGEGGDLRDTRRGLEDHSEVLDRGPFAVLYSVCDRVVDEYELIADELENQVDGIDAEVFSDKGRVVEQATRSSPERVPQEQRIYHLKREMAEFRRAVGPLRDPLLKFAQGQVAGVHKEAEAFFGDVADHAVRVYERVESMDSLLSSAHDALMARISVQQNSDMRKISAWVAMAAVPTMIAGIYGMNFDNMPELHWDFGYPLALSVMALACITMYRLFKRSGWL
jgi:magnesium transporter